MPSMQAVADSSVIVSAALFGSPAHAVCRQAIADTNAGASGHAWVESFSVLTRLPPDLRLTAADASAVLDDVVPRTVGITQPQMASFRAWLADGHAVGGAVFDALVAWAAQSNRLPLLTRDQRAAATYEAVGADVRLLDPVM